MGAIAVTNARDGVALKEASGMECRTAIDARAHGALAIVREDGVGRCAGAHQGNIRRRRRWIVRALAATLAEGAPGSA